jgi:hypothetical protein
MVAAVPRVDPMGETMLVSCEVVSETEERPTDTTMTKTTTTTRGHVLQQDTTYLCASRARTAGFPQWTPRLTRAESGSIEKY